MKRLATVLAAVAVLSLCGMARAEGDTSKAMADIAEKATGSLVAVSGTLQDETGSAQVGGMGLCIDASGVFVTTAIDSRLQLDILKDLKVTVPGADGKTYDAKVLGMDPETNLTFIKVEGDAKWNAIKFARQSNAAIGQRVFSVGLMAGDFGNMPYVGTAYVSSKLRVPDTMFYVIGGKLTAVGSPVFAEDGTAIGLVGRQLYVSYQMAAPNTRGPVTIGLSGRQETEFFLPVEEFVGALDNVPKEGEAPRRLPWVGVVRFDGVNKDLAEINKLSKPGVLADQVVPKQPAAEAGLHDRDIIIGLNGKDIEKLPTPELTARSFVRQIFKMKVGDKVIFTVWREQKPVELSMTLAPMPESPDEAKRFVSPKAGFLVRNKVMLDQFLDKGPTANVPGLIVVVVARNSPAEAAGLQAGDVITSVSDQPVTDVDSLKKAVEASSAMTPPKPVSMTIRRGDSSQTISLQPPASQPAK